MAGHVDGVGRIVDMQPDGNSRRLTVEAPVELARYIAPKGSVALDGISLTVNEVEKSRFGINIVPHTLTHTTLGAKKPGDRVNLEADVFARYVVRAMELQDVKDGLKTVTYAEGKGFLSPIDEIIEDLRNGRMIILVDAEDRENEGDLVIPAQMATPDAINFMAKHGRGLVCLSLTAQRAAQLRLEYMARQNEARNRTAFTVSIEAREGIATGISAHDRARTIATAIDPTKDFNDIVSPGHVFPLIAREGGVLVRAGHTEASVDLARLAGLYPAGVICEIMNDDGTMARMPDLVAFAQRHGLKIGTIEDLIGYRLRHDKIVKEVAKTTVDSAHGGNFDAARVRDRGGAGRASGLRQGRPRRAGPRAGARARRQRADRPVGRRRRGPARLADREGHADDRRGGPGRDRADPRLAAQVGVGVGGSERRAQEPEAGRSRPSGAWSRSASARRSCARWASATWSCSPTRRRRATWASRPSGCTSSASAG